VGAWSSLQCGVCITLSSFTKWVSRALGNTFVAGILFLPEILVHLLQQLVVTLLGFENRVQFPHQ
jgi:hypothetical protein